MGEHDAELILVAGALLAAGIVGALLADRIRIPGLLLFLGLGMLAGSEGIGGIDFNNAELARTLGTIALVLILFEGGLTAGWPEIRPVLGTAASLATVGTVVTAVVTGLAAKWIFGFGTLEGMLAGAAVAATDSAAIFAVLRRSTLEKPLARALEGESGMNDPVALLLVIGFIEWIQVPGFGIADMIGLEALKLSIGIVVGVALGRLAVAAFTRVRFPTDGIYPVATIAIAALAYGIAEVAHGSGLLATYLTALALGGARIPARRTIVAFHEGLGWVAQISLFILLGLLVFPSALGDVAWEALALSAVLILVARPLAAFVATVFTSLDIRERAMLGWAGLRGATPIWLATFPVVAGVAESQQVFAIVFFVVVTSTLIQGATFEPIAIRLGLTTDEPATAAPPARVGADPRHGRRRDRLQTAPRVRRLRPHGPRTRAPPRSAAQRHRPRRPRDPAARLDRGPRRRRAPHPRPPGAARRGREADPALAGRPDRRARPAADAAPRLAPDLLGRPAQPGRRPVRPQPGRRRPRGGDPPQPSRPLQRPGQPRRRPLRGDLGGGRRGRRPPGGRPLVRATSRTQRQRSRLSGPGGRS